ncbi:MAG: DUF2442 domain-containing protein [Pirellulales bacterium]
MKSDKHGTPTSDLEVTNISRHGLWLLLRDREYFLPFEQFPWFKDASVHQICTVELRSKDHLYWPLVDIDLTVESIEHPERFPLVSNARPPVPATPGGQAEK